MEEKIVDTCIFDAAMRQLTKFSGEPTDRYDFSYIVIEKDRVWASDPRSIFVIPRKETGKKKSYVISADAIEQIDRALPKKTDAKVHYWDTGQVTINTNVTQTKIEARDLRFPTIDKFINKNSELTVELNISPQVLKKYIDFACRHGKKTQPGFSLMKIILSGATNQIRLEIPMKDGRTAIGIFMPRAADQSDEELNERFEGVMVRRNLFEALKQENDQ